MVPTNRQAAAPILAVLCFVLCSALPARAASCGSIQLQSAFDYMLCSDPQLAKLNTEVERTYRAIAGKAEVKRISSQKAWREQTSLSCNIRGWVSGAQAIKFHTCLVSKYVKRKNELSKLLAADAARPRGHVTSVDPRTSIEPTTAGATCPVDNILCRQIHEVVLRTYPITAPPQQPATRKAIYESDFASVVVGLSPSPVGYKFVLLATLPMAIDPLEEARLRQAIPSLIRRITANLQSKIDQLPEFDALQPGNLQENFLRHSDNINKALNEAFRVASQDFDNQFRDLSPKYANDNSLAVGLKPCVGSACSLTPLAFNGSKYRFARFYDWASLKGLKTVNQAYVMNPQGTFVPVVATLIRGHEWHDDFPKPLLQAAFVNAVEDSRRTKVPLSYAAAELAGLSKEIVAHLADVFDAPYSAASSLKSNPAVTLQGLSDELGRARLRDCVRLRGSFDPGDAGKCAGYDVKQVDLANCLAGAQCMPAFGGMANMDTLLVQPNTSIADLATSTALPRIQLGNANDLVAAANKCRDEGPNESGYCLLKETVGKDPKSARTLDCIHDAGASASAQVACVTAGLNDDQRRKLECFQKNSKDARALALCATRDSLPPGAQKMIACAENLEGTALGVANTTKCLGVTNVSPEATCLLQNKDSWADAALCISGDKTPPQVKSAVSCAEKHPDSFTGFGVCVVAEQGSGEVQRIAACYAEGQGVPAAVAVCLAAPNLTQDQRIVLECAAETNGAPHATAICAGGKMAAKEMMNCKGKKFGEDHCFNENNEFRKLAKTLGLDIGPKSVVADVINVQLQISQLTLGPLLDAANKELPALIQLIGPGLTPDLNHPGTYILRQLLGPIGAGMVEDYCAHNYCPRAEDLDYCAHNPCPKLF